ncbi:MAG: flavin reductase family protein [Planctomycetaceae bacterium]|jgi:flavin reductase (DIM6/NTAB) family NADH-FMN oxidoreductase RutF|nr:flavin reductase family protein [Planctomycetaceae bacterium]
MQIDISKIPVTEAYQWMVSLVAPRPIAWVTTLSPTGVVNLAPFSFFNVFGANPPVVVFSPTLKRDSTKKDTLINIERLGEFVIHASTQRDIDAINNSSASLAPDVSEVVYVGKQTLPSVMVKVPRLAGAPFALECKLRQIVPVGNGPISANLIIGDVVMMHIDPAILGRDGKVDPKLLRSVARLGGEHWCRSTDLFQMERPQ